MAKRTLFSILSGLPWWVSLLVAMGLFALGQLIFPPVAPFLAFPFVVVAAYLAWKQLRRGSPVDVEGRLAALREMSWENFSLLVSEAYRRRGYTIDAARDGTFDFALQKDGKTTLVQCRRWKVNQVGVRTVQELYDAVIRHEAFNGVCIAAGGFSEGARRFAVGKPITLLSGEALVELIGTVGRTSRRWFSP